MARLAIGELIAAARERPARRWTLLGTPAAARACPQVENARRMAVEGLSVRQIAARARAPRLLRTVAWVNLARGAALPDGTPDIGAEADSEQVVRVVERLTVVPAGDASTAAARAQS